MIYKKGNGGMSEWSKEAVLKTVVPKGTVGSNPTPSARKFSNAKFHEWLVARRSLDGKDLPAMRVRKARRAGREGQDINNTQKSCKSC
jgi:hypothetical protein